MYLVSRSARVVTLPSPAPTPGQQPGQDGVLPGSRGHLRPGHNQHRQQGRQAGHGGTTAQLAGGLGGAG